MIYQIPWLILSALLLFFTLIRPHPYRFSRFLAFESLISLIFLNAKNWFVNPFSLVQVISWLLLLSSLLLALHGFFLLKTRGNPEGDFEDTTLLIKTGAYRFIRHPLYTSLLLFGWGAFLKAPSMLAGGLVFTLILGVFFTAKIEEQHNRARFGQEYQDYCQKTKRFIPGIY